MTFFLVSLLLALASQQPSPGAAPSASPAPSNEQSPPPASGFSGEVKARLAGPDDAPLEKLIFYGAPVRGGGRAAQVRVDVVAGRFVSTELMPPGLRSIATVPPCIPLESLVLNVPEGTRTEKELLGTAFFAGWKPTRIRVGIPGFIDIIFEPEPPAPAPPSPSPPGGSGSGAAPPSPGGGEGATPPNSTERVGGVNVGCTQNGAR